MLWGLGMSIFGLKIGKFKKSWASIKNFTFLFKKKKLSSDQKKTISGPIAKNVRDCLWKKRRPWHCCNKTNNMYSVKEKGIFYTSDSFHTAAT